MHHYLTPERCLPADGYAGTLVARAWVPAAGSGVAGPSVVAITADGVRDLSHAAPTMADLLNEEKPVAAVRAALANAPVLGDLARLLANSVPDRQDPSAPHLLAPPDLQALKASGVTFVASMLERVIEEQAGGDPARAEGVRARIVEIVGSDLAAIRPGSEAALRLKAMLIEQGAWSQYLEVGIGPDAEIFTKSQPMSAVGAGAEIGIHPASSWNNPEPEVVLAVNGRARVVGATLGNDVNLRDVEGRSALLLGKAKDNNASCAIGPFIRLFDETFTLEDVRKADLTMEVHGPEGYRLSGTSSMSKISRDPLDLVNQAIGPNHQYPDGLMLFLGTMFAPIDDRDEPGRGFTHKLGDIVTVGTPTLGTLVNRVNHSDKIAPWTFGVSALLRNLAARGLL